MRTGLAVVFVLLLPLLTPMVQVTSAQPLNGGSDPGVSDTPTWRIGDRWIYSGVFDPTVLITDSGVSASVGEIRGDSEQGELCAHLQARYRRDIGEI